MRLLSGEIQSYTYNSRSGTNCSTPEITCSHFIRSTTTLLMMGSIPNDLSSSHH